MLVTRKVTTPYSRHGAQIRSITETHCQHSSMDAAPSVGPHHTPRRDSALSRQTPDRVPTVVGVRVDNWKVVSALSYDLYQRCSCVRRWWRPLDQGPMARSRGLTTPLACLASRPHARGGQRDC